MVPGGHKVDTPFIYSTALVKTAGIHVTGATWVDYKLALKLCAYKIR